MVAGDEINCDISSCKTACDSVNHFEKQINNSDYRATNRGLV